MIKCLYCGEQHPWWDCRKKPVGWKPTKEALAAKKPAKKKSSGGSSGAERHPSKLGVAGSSPARRSKSKPSDLINLRPNSSSGERPHKAGDAVIKGEASSNLGRGTRKGVAKSAATGKDRKPQPRMKAGTRGINRETGVELLRMGNDPVLPVPAGTQAPPADYSKKKKRKKKPKPDTDRHPPGYMAEYMRKWRAKQKEETK